jgi:hypothetical protein
MGLPGIRSVFRAGQVEAGDVVLTIIVTASQLPGTWMAVCYLTADELVEGILRSTMDELGS